MSDVKKSIIYQIDKNKDEIMKNMQKILTYPSVMGNEEGAQDFYASLLKTMSCKVDVWVPSAEDMNVNPNFLAVRDDYTGSPNVVGILKGTGNGKSIMLNGHIDVVPEGENDWKNSPWSGTLEDGKIYGRGACDMKGGLIANAMAVKAILDAGVKLKGDVILASVIGEETGGAGTLSVISRGYKADGAIVPEPTDEYICPVSLGAIWFRIKVKGIAGHAADATNGVNAINVASNIIKGIEELEAKRAKSVKHELYEYNPLPFCINVGSIKGGIFPTSIPDDVIMEGRLGYSPDEDLNDVKKEFEKVVLDVAKRDERLKDILPEVEWYGFAITSGGVNKDHAIVKALSENYKYILKKEPELRGTPWGTDAGALNRYGNTPAVIFGPGPGNTAHKANECINVEQLLEVTKIIACTIVDWCGFEN